MHQLPELPYDYKSLEPFIDEETMKLHHDKHHATYIENLNKALSAVEGFANMDIHELLSKLDQLPEEIRTKIRNNAGGHANHTFFWNILSPKHNQNPNSDLLQTINHTFGSVDIFQEKFTEKALGRFGSGWVWLVLKEGKLEITDTPNQDNPWMNVGEIPLLGLDVWEHAYYLKYQNRRADYLKAFWNIVNWEEVEKIYASSHQ